MDIVERLRNDDVVWGVRPSLAFEAADEIERLREQLKYSNDFREIMNVERCDALEENERLREVVVLLVAYDEHDEEIQKGAVMWDVLIEAAHAALKETR